MLRRRDGASQGLHLGVLSVNWLGLATAAALLAVWQIAVNVGALTYQYLPAPSGIFTGLIDLCGERTFWQAVGHTVAVTVLGWIIASVVGVTVGLVLGLVEPVWRYSMASVEILRSLPAIAFVPVVILIVGLSIKMELVVVVYVAVWPIIVNTIGGVRQVGRDLHDVATTLHLGRIERVRKLVLPASVPHVLIALRLGLTLSLVLAVVAEMIGNPTGLGFQVVFQQQALQPERMFGAVAVIGIVGVALNASFNLIAGMLSVAKVGGAQ